MFAIVGVAAQLPSGTHSKTDLDYDKFWDFLVNGNQAMEDINELEIQPNPFDSTDLSKLPQKGAFLKTMTEFDYSAFGLSSADARVMPNSARRLMELSFHALRDAGIQTRGKPIGCFMSGNNDLDLDAMSTDGTLAYIPSAIPNRISYAFNLTGPSIAVDTACSSSLTGIHLAISAIGNGDCTAALVGAAQSNRKLTEWWRYDSAHVLSPSGVGRPFDDEADGFTRGEGAVVVVVKSLQEALKDRDHIYCVVAASFHNATGSQLPMYVPNGTAQQICISQAYARAGRTPLEADYVELHMTGTKVGDPIEANAAGQAFCKGNSKVRVGSVKGNIGHLECAAFLASLIKACHVFDKEIIPPTPNFSIPNRSIFWDRYGLDVVTKPIPLRNEATGKAPLISIASAGIGGSTGHVVLEGPPLRNFDATSQPARGTPILFLIGGLTPKAVQDIARQLARLPDDYEVILENAIYASRQARQLPWRSFLVLKNGATFVADIPRPVLAPTTIPKLAFVFSGQGPHNAQMGHQLFQQYPLFRSTVLELDEIHQQVMGYSLLHATGLFSSEIKDSRILQKKWPVILTLPALVMVHVGLFELVKSMGIQPDYLLGHSAGETALIYASGAGSKAMAMEVALARGLAMTCTESMDGAMAVVGCGAVDCQTLINRIHREHGIESDLEISCFNTPDSVVVSGKRNLVEGVIDLARSQGTFAQGIHTLVPGHCKYIEHCRTEHYRLMQDIFSRYPGPHLPAIPVFSTCRPGESVKEFTPDYFWDNARNPVHFSDAISRVLSQSGPSETLFIEVSPHPVLSGAIAAHGVPMTRTICPMQRFPREVCDPHHETNCLLSSAAQISMAGYDCLDLSGLYGVQNHRRPLFNHPLQRSQVPPFKTFALGASQENRPLFSSLPLLSTDAINLFSQHRVENVPVVPATGWIEMVLEAGSRYLWDIKFESLFAVQHDRHPALHFERDGRNKWSIASTQAAMTQCTPSRVVVATGSCGEKLSFGPRVEKLDVTALRARLGVLSLEAMHEVHGRSLSFGRSFTRLLGVNGNSSEILAEVRGLSEEERTAGYILHPAILDACIRVIAYKEFLQDWETTPWFPDRIGKFVLYNNADTSTSIFSYVRLKRWTPDTRSYDILVTNDQGRTICELGDFNLRKAVAGASPKQMSALALTTEPVRIPSTIVSKSRLFQNQDGQAYEQLYRALDYLALKKLRQTLKRQLPCGNSADRIRYLEKMTDMIQGEVDSPNLEESELREQESRWPAFFEVTRRIEGVHESILQSSQAAVNALYADDLMARYYTEHNQLTEACQEMAQQLDNILCVLHGSGKRKVRILEIGAGTGTLTRYLVPILDDHAELVIEYTATDVSYSLVADLARSLRFDGLTPKAYDITKDPFTQGISPESFDVIIAYHALHVAPDLRILGQRLHDVLVPGGFLLATEVDNTSWSSKPGSIWMDFIFGSFAEWFNYQDDRSHCSMLPERWDSLLQSTGLGNFSSITGSCHSLDFVFSCQATIHTEGVVRQPPKFTLFRYRAGQELELQQRFRTFNPNVDGIMCLWTNDGHDSDPAMGLVITLAQEFPTWTIWLAMFGSPVDAKHAETVVAQNHLHLSRERLVHFSAEGAPLLPRVVRLPPVPAETGNQVTLTLPKDYLMVQVVEYTLEGGFIGRVLQSNDPEMPEQSAVAGLAAGVMSRNIIQVHSGSTIQIPRLDSRVLPYLPAMVLQFHILGFSRLIYSTRSYPPLRVLVSLHNVSLQEALQHLLELSPGVKVLTETPKFFVDVVVTDHDKLEKFPLLEQSVGTSGRLIIWSSRLLEQTINQESWIWRDLLNTGIHNLDLSPTENEPQRESGTMVLAPKDRAQNALFDPRKAYILIGGIGGIGLHLAIWLYKNGARYIYLTSRRGRETILHAEDITLRYKLQYLESQEDLNLELVACDALNANETAAFLDKVQLPIGGCFFMPLALHDALFLQQTQDTIDLVRRPKVEAFDILCSLCNVKAMDFFVAFSSVTAIWGNVGQSNYASACTALSGRISKYPNAFALLVPPILDTGYLVQKEVLNRLNFQGAHEWGIGVEELCEYMRDGITRVKLGVNPSLYIPDLDLGIVTKYVSLPPMYHSLIPRSPLGNEREQESVTARQRQVGGEEANDVLKSAREVVMSSLGVDENTFSPDNPFINCGLDSIRATRLSRQLKPYIEVSQTDLLLWMTWNDLKKRIEQKSTKTIEPSEVIKGCQRLVLSALGTDNFSPNVLFVNSGLDPIRATQLSRQLEAYIQISHTELLGMCWQDLEAKLLQGNTAAEQSGSINSTAIDACRKLVEESLGIDTENLDPDIPFLSYGLDSIRATRLSRQLKPYVEVSYMNLLFGTTWKSLEEKIRRNIGSEMRSPAAGGMAGQTGWIVSFTKLDEATRDGPVIFALPGITGTLSAISPLMNHARKSTATVWAAHFDLSSCTNSPPSLEELANAIFEGIRERHPSGDLRIISVSGSSTMAFLLTRALEAEGRHVIDVSFLDHFPALFYHDAYGLGAYMASPEESPEILKALDDVAERGVDIMLRMQEIDPSIAKHPSGGDDVSRVEALKSLETAKLMSVITIKFIKDLCYRSQKLPSERYEETLMKWMCSVKARILVVVADRGFNAVVEMPWVDMGVDRMLENKNNVEVLHIDEGHFGVVGCKTLAQRLSL